MARYARRYRKGRRGNRTLSTRRIFNNKGAKAQAAQINALKKRISRVYNRTKPEYKLVRTDNDNRLFGYQSSASGTPNLSNAFIATIDLPAVGTSDSQRIGNKISISPLTFFLNIAYKHQNEIADNVYPYIQHALQTKGIILRFVAIQSMAATSVAPSISDVFANDYTGANQNPQDLMMMMTMPFKNGITARFKILKDKRFTVTEENPVKATRLKVKPAIRSVRWEDGYTYPRGTIWYMMLIGGAEIQTFTSQTELQTFYNFNALDTTWRHEYAYTDA